MTCKWRDGSMYFFFDSGRRMIGDLLTPFKGWKDRHFFIRGLGPDVSSVFLFESKPEQFISFLMLDAIYICIAFFSDARAAITFNPDAHRSFVGVTEFLSPERQGCSRHKESCCHAHWGDVDLCAGFADEGSSSDREKAEDQW